MKTSIILIIIGIVCAFITGLESKGISFNRDNNYNDRKPVDLFDDDSANLCNFCFFSLLIKNFSKFKLIYFRS